MRHSRIRRLVPCAKAVALRVDCAIKRVASLNVLTIFTMSERPRNTVAVLADNWRQDTKLVNGRIFVKLPSLESAREARHYLHTRSGAPAFWISTSGSNCSMPASSRVSEVIQMVRVGRANRKRPQEWAAIESRASAQDRRWQGGPINGCGSRGAITPLARHVICGGLKLHLASDQVVSEKGRNSTSTSCSRARTGKFPFTIVKDLPKFMGQVGSVTVRE